MVSALGHNHYHVSSLLDKMVQWMFGWWRVLDWNVTTPAEADSDLARRATETSAIDVRERRRCWFEMSGDEAADEVSRVGSRAGICQWLGGEVRICWLLV